MNILLVCCGGITTNILAHKLNEYTKQRHPDYHFYATSFNNLWQYESIDYILIAPQAIIYSDKIMDFINQHRCGYFTLEQSDIINPRYEIIFSEISEYGQNCSTRETTTLINDKFKIVKILLRIVLITLASSVFAAILELSKSCGIINNLNLYYAVYTYIFFVHIGYIGYVFSKFYGFSALFCIFLNLMTNFLLIPYQTSNDILIGTSRIVSLVVSSSVFKISSIIISSLYSFLTLSVYSYIVVRFSGNVRSKKIIFAPYQIVASCLVVVIGLCIHLFIYNFF